VLDYHGDVSSFQSLFRHLDAAYRDVDAVFAANGLADMVITPSDVHIREGVGGKYLEVFSNKVLPFKLQDATEAAWEHFKGTDKHMGNGSLYSKAKKVSGRHCLSYHGWRSNLDVARIWTSLTPSSRSSRRRSFPTAIEPTSR
jgi:hypothetical protein